MQHNDDANGKYPDLAIVALHPSKQLEDVEQGS
jgi:hypothetical protein